MENASLTYTALNTNACFHPSIKQKEIIYRQKDFKLNVYRFA